MIQTAELSILARGYSTADFIMMTVQGHLRLIIFRMSDYLEVRCWWPLGGAHLNLDFSRLAPIGAAGPIEARVENVGLLVRRREQPHDIMASPTFLVTETS